MTQHCTRPPEGWWCSRPADHDGPCAAREGEREPFLYTQTELDAAIAKTWEDAAKKCDSVARDHGVLSAQRTRDGLPTSILDGAVSTALRCGSLLRLENRRD